MSRTVHCAKLGRDAEGLDFAPYPGELGARIYSDISKEAWAQWLAHQTMLINENHLNVMQPEAQTFLSEQREKFLSNADYERPKGWTPEKK